MTRKHHPKSRAERLALKKLDEKPKKGAAKVRHHIIDDLRDKEYRDELKQVADYQAPSQDDRGLDRITSLRNARDEPT